MPSESDVTLINNTFYGNTADDGGGLGFYAEAAEDSATLQNEIYWNNTPNSLAVFGAGPVAAQYCNIEGGTGQSWFGTGCIDSNPSFYNSANPAGADGIYATLDDGLHLTGSSPSMNTGNNAVVPVSVTTDIAGETRIQNTVVDMGAYEGAAGTSMPLCSECSDSPVILTGVTFKNGTSCRCTDTVSITFEAGVTVETGATVIFEAPLIRIKSGFQAENGSVVNMKPQ